MKVYLIGSLREDTVPTVAKRLRAAGFDVFDDWYAAGPIADDSWQKYETDRGRPYDVALKGEAAKNVYNFDKRHLEEADACVLVMPAGKSGHLELGWMLGKGKPGFVLFEKEPERWDVMYQFANGVFFDVEKLVEELRQLEAVDVDRYVNFHGRAIYDDRTEIIEGRLPVPVNDNVTAEPVAYCYADMPAAYYVIDSDYKVSAYDVAERDFIIKDTTHRLDDVGSGAAAYLALTKYVDDHPHLKTGRT